MFYAKKWQDVENLGKGAEIFGAVRVGKWAEVCYVRAMGF